MFPDCLGSLKLRRLRCSPPYADRLRATASAGARGDDWHQILQGLFVVDEHLALVAAAHRRLQNSLSISDIFQYLESIVYYLVILLAQLDAEPVCLTPQAGQRACQAAANVLGLQDLAQSVLQPLLL